MKSETKLLLFLSFAVGAVANAQKPNIIVVLADDMGYSDLGCFGSEINTPNLDALAANGIRFKQFYNSARCCPTRASLLTGLHPHQAGMGHMAGGKNPVPETTNYQGYLNNESVTIAEVLAQSGYFTAHSGKWHVGSKNADMKPNGRGFLQSIDGQGFYYGSDTKGKDPEMNGKKMTGLDETWYSTIEYAKNGIRFIDMARKEGKPIFLYLAFNAPHWPLQAPDSVLNQYIGKYKQGWEAMREIRFNRQKQMGLIAPDVQLSPADDRIRSWKSLSETEKLTQDSIMAAYAACVHLMDYGVGLVVEHLKANKMYDNTLIMFLADNGACAEGPKSGLGNNSGKGKIGSPESFVRCGQGWANFQNTPYREYKHWTHEGATHTSFIAHWPDKISQKGSFYNEPGHIVDIMATCVDAAQASYPSKFKGNKVTPMEGVSLLPALAAKPLNRDTLCWEHEANRGIRVKNMKLVLRAKNVRQMTPNEKEKWELYDLDVDPTELNNLSAKQPQLVKRMSADWYRWANAKGVLPWPWGSVANAE
jgi:arylsulfatase A-like enzyme